jgi:protein required for attachment to host cells
MLLSKGTVFALVDGEEFELYRNDGLESEPRLEKLESPELDATNFSAGARNKDKISRFTAGAPKDKGKRLDESAHAAALAAWLNQQVQTGGIERLVTFADPRSLGEMRRHYTKDLSKALVRELDRTMTGRPPAEIVKALQAAS